MKKLYFLSFLIALMFVVGSADTMCKNRLSIGFKKFTNGLVVSSIKNVNTELLYQESELFSLGLQKIDDAKDLKISSSRGWGSVKIVDRYKYTKVVFSNPIDALLPQSLKVIAKIAWTNKKSIWDLKVTGVGNRHSLLEAVAPKLSLISSADAKLLVPKYSGQLISNPAFKNISYNLLYPRGWASSMQFLAHYDENIGVYFGFHDPKASKKRFIVNAKNGFIDISCNIPIPNATKSSNDWDFPGIFELDLFDGDWYDASMIYKDWASKEAEYWPRMTKRRRVRQAKIGEIGVWTYYRADLDEPMEQTAKNMSEYIDYFEGVPVGIHWYRWNYQDFDDNYPVYFPQREGMKKISQYIQSDKNSYVMPYVNGRLFDTDLPNYKQDGYPFATKDSNGTVLTQTFNHNLFAVMCPTQKNWQDKMVGISKTLTQSIGTSGIYLDQVAAAGPVSCMDKSHNHPLGGGHWWSDGYNQMFNNIHKNISSEKFITVEGCNDYIINQVDGFLTQGWTTNDLVPAFQAVYSGRVQLFGTRTGTSEYKNQAYYSKYSQAFVNGIQIGRTSSWLVADDRADGGAEYARVFVKRLATMRYKLRNFLSYGSLQRSVKLTGNIPNITSTWHDYGEPVSVTTPAIESSIYKNIDGSVVAFIFVNASMDKTISCSFEVDGSLYGLEGKLKVQKITQYDNSKFEILNNKSVQKTILKPLEVKAFIFSN